MIPVTRAEAIAAGERLYFTGRPCKRGHLAPRMVANRLCVECNKAACSDWHAANREAANARRMEWTARNRQRHYRNCLAYQRRHPDKHCAHQSRRRAQARARAGRYTDADVARIMRAQRGRCASCRCDLSTGKHIDHIHPLALGGSNGPENIQLLCPPCNQKKGAKHPIEWRQSLGGLL